MCVYVCVVCVVYVCVFVCCVYACAHIPTAQKKREGEGGGTLVHYYPPCLRQDPFVVFPLCIPGCLDYICPYPYPVLCGFKGSRPSPHFCVANVFTHEAISSASVTFTSSEHSILGLPDPWEQMTSVIIFF